MPEITGLDRPAVQRPWTGPPAIIGLVPRVEPKLDGDDVVVLVLY
jgi:hypothetical protein